METVTLTLAFLSAATVSWCVVMAFSEPIDGVLGRLLAPEQARAWSRYAKFAVLAASFTGGMRFPELGALVAAGAGGPAPTVGQGMLEIFKTIAGALTAGSWVLLLFFAATLVLYAGGRAYDSFKAQSAPRGGADRHGPAPSVRLQG